MSPVIFVLMLAVTEPATPIAHCREADGAILFTDPPCPPRSVPLRWQSGATTWIDFGNLPDRTERSRPIRRPLKTRHTMALEDECKKVQQQLDALRDTRRRGYRLSEAARLEREETRLKSARRKLC
jgi:hypothetical protein